MTYLHLNKCNTISTNANSVRDRLKKYTKSTLMNKREDCLNPFSLKDIGSLVKYIELLEDNLKQHNIDIYGEDNRLSCHIIDGKIIC